MASLSERIRARRESLGLDANDVAKELGLSWSEYYDIEAYDHEFPTVPDLSRAKQLCARLGLDILSLLNKPRAHPPTEGSEKSTRSRSGVIRERRTALNLSEAELGDLIGWEASAIHDVEAKDGGIEAYPIFFIEKLSEVLGIPFETLIE